MMSFMYRWSGEDASCPEGVGEGRTCRGVMRRGERRVRVAEVSCAGEGGGARGRDVMHKEGEGFAWPRCPVKGEVEGCAWPRCPVQGEGRRVHVAEVRGVLWRGGKEECAWPRWCPA